MGVLLSLVLIGCGGGGSSTVEDSGVSDVAGIGVEGGTVELDGVTVTIPAGALDGEVAISIEATSVVGPDDAIGEVYAFLPHGTTFSAPVTVSFPTTETEVEVRWSEDETTWTSLDTTVADGLASVEVSSFSWGVVAAADSGIVPCTGCQISQQGQWMGAFEYRTYDYEYDYLDDGTQVITWEGWRDWDWDLEMVPCDSAGFSAYLADEAGERTEVRNGTNHFDFVEATEGRIHIKSAANACLYGLVEDEYVIPAECGLLDTADEFELDRNNETGAYRIRRGDRCMMVDELTHPDSIGDDIEFVTCTDAGGTPAEWGTTMIEDWTITPGQ